MKSASDYIGRILLSVLFLFSAYWHIANWDTAIQKMTEVGVRSPSTILIITTALLIVGGLSILFGIFIRIGAILIIIEIIWTAIMFNPFWQYSGFELQISLLAFLTRMAICGGVVLLFKR